MNSLQEALNRFTQLDHNCTYIPLASTFTNLAILVNKVFQERVSTESSINHSSEPKSFFDPKVYVREKSLARCVILLVPVYGNMIVFIVDCLYGKYDIEEIMLQEIKKDPQLIQKSSRRLMRDADYLLKAIEINYEVLKFIDEDFRSNEKFMLEAIERNYKSIQFVDARLVKDETFVQRAKAAMQAQVKDDEQVALDAFKNFDFPIQDLSKRLQSNQKFILQVAKIDCVGVKGASKKLLKDKSFICALVEQEGFRVAEIVLENFSKDQEFLENVNEIAKTHALESTEGAIYAIQNGHKDGRKFLLFKDLKEEQKGNLEIALAAIEEDICSFDHVPAEFKDSDEFMKKAIEINPNAWKKASDRIQKSRWAACLALEKDPSLYKYFHLPLKSDHQVALTALTKDTKNLQFLPEKLKKDSEFIKAAIPICQNIWLLANANIQQDHSMARLVLEHNGGYYQFLPHSLKEDPDIAWLAISQDLGMQYYLPPILRDNALFMDRVHELTKRVLSNTPTKDKALQEVGIDGLSLKYFPGFKEDPEVAYEAVKQNPKAYQYVGASLKTNKKFMGSLFQLGDFFICEILKEDGFHILMASKEVQRKAEYAIWAVEQNGLVLEKLNDLLRNNPRVVNSAILQNPEAYKYMGSSLKTNEKYIKAALKNEELMRILLVKDIRLIEYLDPVDQKGVLIDLLVEDPELINLCSKEVQENNEILRVVIGRKPRYKAKLENYLNKAQRTSERKSSSDSDLTA